MNNARIGVLGPRGSYSQEAVIKKYPDKTVELYPSIKDLLNALDNKEVDKILLPFENSIHGTVLETLDGVYARGFKIISDIKIPIKHVIAGLDKNMSKDKIKNIYSHQQALSQVSNYLDVNYPEADRIPVDSTSTAFEMISRNSDSKSLAIGSETATKIYNLQIIDRNIQDSNNNETLFVEVVADNVIGDLPYSIFVIDPNKDYPGLLYDVLSIFKEKNINLSKLESRPTKNSFGSYIFYVKADTDSSSDVTEDILKSLEKIAKVSLITN